MKLFKLGGLGSKKAQKEIEKINAELLKRDKEIEKLKKDIDVSNKTIIILEDKLDNVTGLYKLSKICVEEREEAIKKLKKDKMELTSSKGGYIAKISSLTNELEETKKQLEESMTDKYLVRKIPSGRTPKKQTVRSNTKNISSQSRKRLEEKSELKEQE